MIDGYCHPDFESVARTFRENFAERGEVGANVAIYRHGQKVVDLWGGVSDPETGDPWREDSIVCVMSCTKAMTALAVLVLADRKKLNLNDRASEYWPNFAQAGKGEVTVEEVTGGRAGVLYADTAPQGSVLDTVTFLAALERQPRSDLRPSGGAYHSLTCGFLNGEIVRGATGADVYRLFEEEIRGPVDAELYALRDHPEVANRVSSLIPNPESVTLRLIGQETGNKLARAYHVLPMPITELLNSPGFRYGYFPSGNFHGNGRGLATIYNRFVTPDLARRILSDAMIERIRKPQWDGECGLTGRDYRYGLGFFLSGKVDANFGPNPRTFGHHGAGGAVGFADPDEGISFGYTPNFMCSGQGLGNRCEALIGSMYASIG